MVRRSKRPTARLIIHQSTLYYHPPDSSILKSVDQGLFARSIFEPGDTIVQITNDTVLDCYTCWLRC
jgi:hypothetical protein